MRSAGAAMDAVQVREALLSRDNVNRTLRYGLDEEPACRLLARHYIGTVRVLALTRQPKPVVERPSRFD